MSLALQRRVVVRLLLTSCASATAISAQSPNHPFFDSLLTTLDRTSTIASLPIASCAAEPSAVASVCRALIAGRRSELTRLRDEDRAAEVALERAVIDEPKWAAAWYGLASMRLHLAHDTLFTRGGALMPVGVSYLSGSASAYMEALRLDPTFSRAAEALAMLPRPREGSSAMKARVAALRKVRAGLSPAAEAAVANVERDAGSVDSAIALEQRALASGDVDVGVVSLGLVRDLYRIGQPARGRAVLLAASANPTMATAAAYRTELEWVASPRELAAWDALTPAARPAWLADFWQKRDIAEGRKDGARLIEHYRRIEYAMQRFRITLPETGRQRALSHSGTIDYAAEEEAQKWALRHPDCAPDLVRLINASHAFGSESPIRYYKPIQDQIDDRGIIYVRHGAPTRTARTVGGLALEVWRYERADGPLVLQFMETDFDASNEATVLVPTLLTLSPAMRNQVCALESSLCSADQRFPGGPVLAEGKRLCSSLDSVSNLAMALNGEVALEGTRLTPDAIIRARDNGRAQIDRAITTDSYHRDAEHEIRPSLQLFGLARTDGGAPRLVAAFALPRDQLKAAKSNTDGSEYPVAIQLMASDASGHRVDLDTLRTFVTSVASEKNQFITGLVELPVPAGAYHVTFVASQEGGRLGIAHLAEVDVPGQGGALAVSDLVIGSASSGVRWNSGTTEIALNPLNTFPVGGTAEIYFQLSGLRAGTNYPERFDVYRVGDDSTHPPRLTVSFGQPAEHERMEVSRSLGLAQLDAGTYRVKVTVGSGSEAKSTVGWLTIVR